jgi:hypothetical protein
LPNPFPTDAYGNVDFYKADVATPLHFQISGNGIAPYDIPYVFISTAGNADLFSSPPPIGNVTPNTGDFTHLTSTSGALNGTIGSITPNTGVFTVGTFGSMFAQLSNNVIDPLVNNPGADVAIQINAAAIANCGGAGSCYMQLPPGNPPFNFTTTINAVDSMILDCGGDTLYYTGSGWAFLNDGLDDVSLINCNLKLGASALGFAQATSVVNPQFRHLRLDGSEASTSSTWFQIDGTVIDQSSGVYFDDIRNVPATSTNNIIFKMAHVTDVHRTNILVYGTLDNTTMVGSILDSAAQGIYSTNEIFGFAGLHGLVVQNLEATTTTTGNVSAGSNVTIPVVSASGCVGEDYGSDLIWIGTFGGTSETPVITGANTGAQTITVAALSNGYTAPVTVSCAQAPGNVFAVDFISSASPGGDSIYADPSLNYGAGNVIGYRYKFTTGTLEGAGMNSNGTVATATAVAVHISGGVLWDFDQVSLRDTARDLVLVDEAPGARVDLFVHGVQGAAANKSNNGAGSGVRVTTNVTGIHVTDNVFDNSAVETGHQKYALYIPASGAGDIIFTGNNCNSETGCYSVLAAPPQVQINSNSFNSSFTVIPDNHSTGSAEFGGSAGNSAWVQIATTATGGYSSFCANGHLDQVTGMWTFPSNGSHNSGTCLMGAPDLKGSSYVVNLPDSGTPTLSQSIADATLKTYVTSRSYSDSPGLGQINWFGNANFGPVSDGTSAIIKLGTANSYMSTNLSTSNWALTLNSVSSLFCTPGTPTCGSSVTFSAPTFSGGTYISNAVTVIASGVVDAAKLGATTGTVPVSASGIGFYNHSGTPQALWHVVVDTCTLGTSCSVTLAGSAVFTSSSTYTCNVEDATSAAASEVVKSSGSAFAITGTGTDVLWYTCTGY